MVLQLFQVQTLLKGRIFYAYNSRPIIAYCRYELSSTMILIKNYTYTDRIIPLFSFFLKEKSHKVYIDPIETLEQISTTYSPMGKIDVLRQTFAKINGVSYHVHFYHMQFPFLCYVSVLLTDIFFAFLPSENI